MSLLVTVAAMLAPTPAVPVDVDAAARPRPALTYGHAGRRRAHRQLEAARWYLRRYRSTRPYRGWLASTRACETRGQARPYRTNTGNGYSGAYQFDLTTWRAVGGRGYPHLAPPLEQDYRAVILLHRRGTSPWPVCGV